MLFKDWRQLDQSSVGLIFEKQYVYYLHSRAWALKGWAGGTHSWITFWSAQHNKWLVVEFTDKETIEIQHAEILYSWNHVGYLEHSPIISNRINDAKWFGTDPVIVGNSINKFSYDDFVKLCEEYPIKQFKLLNQNCNTFISYIVAKLGLSINRPLRSIGFRNKKNWDILHDSNSID